ncbi:helix-turn-helix domain-containing protein, partial [Streptomyces javensis]
ISDRTRERHQTIHELHHNGHSLRGIAAQLGLARNTVRRFLRAATAEDLLIGKWTGRTSILDPHKPREGLDAARARGRVGGRPTVATEEVIRAARDLLPDPGHSITSIAKLLGVSPGTLHNHIPDLRELRSGAIPHQLEAPAK